MEITCPQCEAEHSLPIASLDPEKPAWHHPTISLKCPCGFEITHDALCAERLRQDIVTAVTGGPGVRGTFSPPFAQGAAINAALREHYSASPPALVSHPTASELAAPLKTPKPVLEFYLPTSPWSSSCISLTAAVQRQVSFVDKMHHWLWVRGPTATTGTLPRALEKYHNFFLLFARFPNETMVPTLDLDVFWHTHQLSPARYYRFCLEVAGRFIDHNDRLGTNVLDDGFKRTGERYAGEFQKEYGGCFCWSCELERDDPGKGDGGRWMRGRREKRKEWERRVTVFFWREVERQRQEGGDSLSVKGLEKVLREGPKGKKK